ncbi:STAS domain-containing protein [Streptomyces acidiscabies]|uniref:STAS domain-containing protein n=1 Tax=Streptomyces acidiscabies TaxID=42234 RepID=UPI0009A10415|nr:STAS domain-containing protein [Streptomyces acidiscabies]
MDPEGLPVVIPRSPFTPDVVEGLSDEVRRLLAVAVEKVVVVDVGGLGPPGLAQVDLVARLQLVAKRAGGRIRLRNPGPAFVALLGLVGLVLEVEGEAEEGEPAGGVEVEVETG